MATNPANAWYNSSFELKNTEAYDISILSREEDYFFVVTGLEKSRPLAMGRQVYASQEKKTGKEDAGKKDGPKGFYRRLLLYSLDDNFTLFPSSLQDIYKNGACLAPRPVSGKTITYTIQGELSCSFLYPELSLERFGKLGKEILPRHFAANAISLGHKLARDKGSEILLAVQGHGILTIVLHGREKLIFEKAFECRTDEDAAYHFLNVFRHFSPQLPDLLSILAGDISSGHPAGMLVMPYLKKQEDLLRSCAPDVPMELQGEEELFLASLCVL